MSRAPPRESRKVLIEISVSFQGHGVSNALTLELPEGYEPDPQAMAFWIRDNVHRDLLAAGEKKRTVESGASLR